MPRPNEAGHLAYNHAILTHLAGLGHDVTVVLAHPRMPALRQGTGALHVVGPGLRTGPGSIAVARPRDALRILSRTALGLLPRALGERLRRQGRTGTYGDVDAIIGRFLTPAEAEEAARFTEGADWVIADTIFRAPVLDFAGRARPAIITHDIFHARHAALAGRGLKLFPASLEAAQEAALLAKAQLLVAIQPEEAEALQALVPGTAVLTALMPARLVPRAPGTPREDGRIVFVGSSGAHNADGMRWFLAEVWPQLQRLLPTARLDVCGTVCRTLGSPPPGVTLHGMVPDLAPMLHRASVAVAPLRAGSGLKIKLLDYVAHGLVTVTTPVGTAGFLRTADWPFVEADNAVAFAAAAAHLAQGAGPRDQQALDYAARYDAAHVFGPLAQALASPA